MQLHASEYHLANFNPFIQMVQMDRFTRCESGIFFATLNKQLFLHTKNEKKKRTKTPIHHRQASIFQAAKLEMEMN